MTDRYPYRHHGTAVHGSKLADYLISEANMIEDLEQLRAETAREKLAAVICESRAVDNTFALPCDYDLADAIIAAMPGMVKPLEWKTQKYWSPEQIGHHAVPYSIYENPENGACVLTSGAPWFFGPEYTSDADAAKAIANAHHRAAIMAALGVEGE